MYKDINIKMVIKITSIINYFKNSIIISKDIIILDGNNYINPIKIYKNNV